MSGFPGRLPQGERVLWTGAPDWRALARDALHVRGLALYMGALVAAVAVSAVVRGTPAGSVALQTAFAAVVASVPVGLALLYAWLAARGTRYAITDRRVVMRIGVALPMTLNLPFSKIAAADLRRGRGTGGEIRLQVTELREISIIVLWPFARLGRSAPVLRALPDAEAVAQLLSRALAASMDAPVPLALPERTVQAERRGTPAVPA